MDVALAVPVVDTDGLFYKYVVPYNVFKIKWGNCNCYSLCALKAPTSTDGYVNMYSIIHIQYIYI